MLTVGTLVRYKEDGDFGLITKIIPDDPMGECYWVKWGDGNEGEYYPDEFEVLS